MAIVKTIIPEVQQIMDDADVRELFIVGREFERPPWFHAGKGGDTRLARALRVCTEGRITPNSDGSFTVEGSEGRTYRVDKDCSCPQSQKGSSRFCYHAVSVAVYIEWQRRLRTTPSFTAPRASDPDDDPLGNGSPVDDETLPLPLPPTSVDERLAHAPTIAQEAPMPVDAYIPEPETVEAATAILEPPVPDPVRVTIPAEYVMSIKGKRHVLYAGLVIGAQRSGLVSLAADWTYNDAELSLAHAVATFADGRRYEDSGDASPANVNKGIAAHFRRVALTRAKARCLRDALGIQECSVEELEEETPKREVPDLSRPPTEQDLRHQIWAIVKTRAPACTSSEQVKAWITQQTGYALHPDHYQAILHRLREEAR